MDPGLNQLLKWGIENASPSPNSTQPTTNSAQQSSTATRGLDAQALQALMGGPSDADLMKESMAAIQSPDISLPNKLIAFDNFEQLIEQIDNANNMHNLGLWTPLLAVLQSDEPELRRMAAWCMGTAVQNNVVAQERLLAIGAIPPLIKLALEDPHEGVRRKAIYAISSEIRNYPPGLNAAMQALPSNMRSSALIEAGDMDAVDGVIERLKTSSAEKAA